MVNCLFIFDNILCSLLIGLGAPVDPLEFRSFTPLHLSSKAGLDRASSFLLECGADVNARGRGDETPLHRARDPPTARLLLGYGAGPFATMHDRKGDKAARVSVFKTVAQR